MIGFSRSRSFKFEYGNNTNNTEIRALDVERVLLPGVCLVNTRDGGTNMEYYYFVYQDVGNDYETSGVIAAENVEAAKQGLFHAKDKSRITLMRLSSLSIESGEVVIAKTVHNPR